MDVTVEIVALLREHYVDPDSLEAWINAVDPSRLSEQLADIGSSHTQLLKPDEIDYFHLLDAYSGIAEFARKVRRAFSGGVHYPGIGLLPRKGLEDRWFASSIMPNSAATRAGVLLGDELIAVNGAPYAPIMPFAGLEGRECVLEIRRTAEGEKRQLTAKVQQIRPGTDLMRSTRANTQKLRAPDGTSVGYIRPWSLAGRRHWRLVTDAAINQLSDCQRLVLDLRDGVGGASPDFAEFFIGRSPELNLRARRGGVIRVNPHWRKPVVLLVDGTTRSGNEVLAFALQRNGAIVIGSRTAGAVAAARPFLLSDRSLLLVATHRVEVDGAVLEGEGIKPDIFVETPLDYAAGTDPVLQTGLTLNRC
ncbi:S41 family peptidase [Mesorhizobium sp. M0040]|uniref:S41 family peptidase n=1 Tax=Mesorhizobium sp. M0040 TaxID=2956855 RepID=UPI00333A76E8